jgi:ABC-type bacteriocin/lantibiotic exporter with double-glycine peptidase domain
MPPIPATGGESFTLRVDRPPTHFLQTDPRWANETVGGSEEAVASVGCTLCSLAMALNRVGVELDPATLNSALKAHHGYNERGWLLWSAVTPASGNRARAHYYSRFDHGTIDQAMRDRCLPVVKFFLPGGVSHWVVVVGKSGTDYLVRDPLDEAGVPVALSKLTAEIHGLRCVERQQQ